MLQLHTRLPNRWPAEPEVLRVTSDIRSEAADREAFLLLDGGEVPEHFRLKLCFDDARTATVVDNQRLLALPASFRYLAEGDIIRMSPATGHLSVLYRRMSRFNSILLTERCNSNCVMCSQPPKSAPDDYLVETYLRAIPLMSPDTGELGITGGEPTLLGPRFLGLIAACKENLPNTSLHILSNGRMFNYLSLCQAVASIEHPDLVIGVPLYSDIASMHNFVVQARGAFDQTIRGLMNLARCGIRVELRVVLQRYSVQRLTELARFIVRNLPFVEHIALMALEPMGYARGNLDALWVDPYEYQEEVTAAVRQLDRHGLRISLYNHQLCTLPRELWPFARKSISDWKNEYLAACDDCSVRDECGGFFASASLRVSDHIRPMVVGVTNRELEL